MAEKAFGSCLWWVSACYLGFLAFFSFFLRVTAKFLMAFDFAAPNIGPLCDEGGKVGGTIQKDRS